MLVRRFDCFLDATFDDDFDGVKPLNCRAERASKWVFDRIPLVKGYIQYSTWGERFKGLITYLLIFDREPSPRIEFAEC